MAALRGTLHPNGRTSTTRLAHRWLEVHADTWRTFVTVALNADGSGTVTVKRDGAVIHSATFEPEPVR